MSNQNKYESDASFLARWAENRLSEEELSEFEKSEAFKDFDRINTFTQQFSAPPIDKEAALKNTKAKFSVNNKKKVISLKPYIYAVAASIALIIGVLSFFNATITYNNPKGGKLLAITLPDNSTIKLNAGSTLTRKRFLWNNNRTLHLNGEAYFEVEKGEKFSVSTDYGTVSVLGTKFNIKARKNIFDLHCFEGAVRFDQKDSNNNETLYQNDRIFIQKTSEIKKKKVLQNTPSWIDNISVFKQQPLQVILDDLSIQYNVEFKTNNTNLQRLFSGSFIHNNLDTALKTTLKPMGIDYSISKKDNNKTIIILK